MRFYTLLFAVGALACGRTSEIAADDGTGGSAGSAGSSGGSGGSSGAGASGGSGGSSGSAGSSGSGGSSGSAGSSGLDLTHYHSCELPTGALRYGVYKADPARDLCFLLVVGNQDPTFSAIQVSPSGLGVEGAHVWQGAATCGDYPQPATGAVSADGGTGTVSVTPSGTPAEVELDVTLTFPQNQSWVPASEQLDPAGTIVAGFDCASCNQKADAYANLLETSTKPGGGPNGCTSVVRLDYATRTPLWHTVVCDILDPTNEATARATAEAMLDMMPGSSLLSGPSTDQWLFRGPVNTAIPEGDRIVATVSARTGTLTFGGNSAWFGVGDAKHPTNYKPGSELGGGCPALARPAARGFTALENVKKVELDAAEVDQVMDTVWATALPQGIQSAWGHGAFDAMVVLYPKTLGFSPETSEYVVLVNHGWLE